MILLVELNIPSTLNLPVYAPARQLIKLNLSIQLKNLTTLLQNKSLFQAICPGSLWARDNRWLLSRVQRLAGPGGRGLLYRLVSPTGTKLLGPLIPFPLPRPSHSAQLFLLFLARERGVLTHFFTIFVKIFDSPVHPSALKVCGLFFSSSLACIAHFIL